MLGLRPVTARVRLHRARGAVRRRLSDDDSPAISTSWSITGPRLFRGRLLDELRAVVGQAEPITGAPARHSG